MIDYPTLAVGSERERKAISDWLLAAPDRQPYYVLVGRLLHHHLSGRETPGERLVDLLIVNSLNECPTMEPRRVGFQLDPNRRQPVHTETGVLLRIHEDSKRVAMPAICRQIAHQSTRMRIGESSILVPTAEAAIAYETVTEFRETSAAARRELANWIMLAPDADMTRFPLLPRDHGVINMTKQEMLHGYS